MADTTSPDYLNILTGLGTNYLTQQSNAAGQTAIQNALAQGTNVVNTAYNQAANLQQPYLAAGTQALPQYQQSVTNMANPMTIAQYQSSPYYEAANLAQKQQADQLRAQASTTGMYGSGNMANALSQNALTTQMGAYGQANQADLARQQAYAGGLWNPVGTGATAAQALGNKALESAQYQAANIGAAGQSAALGASQQNALTNQLLSQVPSVLKDLYTRYINSPSSVTAEEYQQLDPGVLNAISGNYSTPYATDFNYYDTTNYNTGVGPTIDNANNLYYDNTYTNNNADYNTQTNGTSAWYSPTSWF